MPFVAHKASHMRQERTIMNQPLRIYIAAPYNPVGCTPHTAVQVAQRNVDRVVVAANAIHDKGHYAFVPHFSHYLHIHESCKVDRGPWYYEYDNTFLDLWANAFLYLAPSYGADMELERFKKRSPIEVRGRWVTMPIFTSVDEIYEVGND